MTWSSEIEAGFGDLLDAVGEPVSWIDGFGELHLDAQGQLPRALYKRPGQTLLSDMQISEDYAIEYREADFQGIRHGDRIEIQRQTYQVRTILQGDDDALRVATLKRIEAQR